MAKMEKSMFSTKISKSKKLTYGLLWTTGVLIYETDMQHGDGRNYWPFHPVLLDSLAAPFVFYEFYRLLKKLEKNGYDDFSIARLLYSPTKVATYQYLWSCLERFLSVSEKPLASSQKHWLAGKFAKLLSIMRNGEPFCENFRNVVWNENKVSIIKRDGFLDKTKNRKFFKLLSELETYLVFYSELLNYYFIDLSRFYHGPYITNNKQIFVKEFTSLKAVDRYQFLKDFPFDHFQEIGIYPKDVKIQIFFMGHTHISKPFPKVIEKTLLKLDGKIIGKPEELKQYLDRVKLSYARLAKLISENERNQNFLLRNGISALFFNLKPLYEAVHEDWKRILPQAYDFAEKNRKRVKIPGPWGKWDAFKATKFLFKEQWKIVTGRPIGKEEIKFINSIEKLSKNISEKESSLQKSYSLVKTLGSL